MKRTSRRILGCVVAGLLVGCGVDVEPVVSTAQEVRDRTLKRIETVEGQLAVGKPALKDIRRLMVSVKFLHGHMTAQKVGTDEQISVLAVIRDELEQHYGGRRSPAATVDMQPLRALLPKLRETVQAVK